MWIRYSRGKKRYDESSESQLKRKAVELLQQREDDIVHGKPVTPKWGKLTHTDAAADLIADYTTNERKSLAVVGRRIDKHLTPYFEHYRMSRSVAA